MLLRIFILWIFFSTDNDRHVNLVNEQQQEEEEEEAEGKSFGNVWRSLLSRSNHDFSQFGLYTSSLIIRYDYLPGE